jgi:hypothetical protein
MALGMDTRGTVLFFLEWNAVPEIRLVDLQRVRACRVIKSAAGKEARTDAPDRVELCLLPAAGGQEIRLVLYRQTPGSVLTGEIQLAERWADIVARAVRR